MSNDKKNDIQIPKYEIEHLIFQIFKLNRSHLRFMKTFSVFAKAIGKENELIKAYSDSIKEEKEKLLKLLEGQLKYLYELNAPPFIVASKQHEVDSAKEIIGDLDIQSAKKLFEKELHNLQEKLSQDIIDLTTNFVSDGDYPTNLGLDFFEDGEQWKHELIKT